MTTGNLVTKLGRRVYSKSSEIYFHNYYKRMALEFIKDIQENNSLKLSPKIKKQADDYANQVFGNKDSALWFYVYSLLYGDFKEGWIPADFYEQNVSPINGLNVLTSYKTFTNVALKTDIIPDLAYYINGNFYTRDFSVIKFPDLVELLREKCTEVFVKKDYSARGRGINKFELQNLNEDAFKRIGNCVIQLSVKNHHFFREMMPDSLSTLRITTVINPEGKVEYRAAFLRLGLKNDKWVDALKEIDIAVDKDGVLDDYGYDGKWKGEPRHPDTGYEYSQKRLPMFKEAVETCIQLHTSVPHFRIIGWDIAISDDERIRLLEWNGALTDVVFHQATLGPCFSGLHWEQLRAKN
jgi:hypothetical protein